MLFQEDAFCSFGGYINSQHRTTGKVSSWATETPARPWEENDMMKQGKKRAYPSTVGQEALRQTRAKQYFLGRCQSHPNKGQYA